MGFQKQKGANSDTHTHARQPHKGVKILKYTLFTNIMYNYLSCKSSSTKLLYFTIITCHVNVTIQFVNIFKISITTVSLKCKVRNLSNRKVQCKVVVSRHLYL